jgi:hypothetical protein
VKVIVILPGQPPGLATITGKRITLDALYSILGSPVEAVGLGARITLWCNEEGRLNGMPPSIYVPPGHRIYGPCLIARDTPSGSTVGLTAADIARWLPIVASWPRITTNPRRRRARR